MGRKKTAKKRKTDEDADNGGEDDEDDLFAQDNDASTTTAGPTPQEDKATTEITTSLQEATKTVEGDEKKETKPSNYAIKTHSAEIFDADIYVSDGSEDEDDQVEIVLIGSRMGIMRRGIHQPGMLLQQNRQWVRPDKSGDNEPTTEDLEASEEQRMADELANLDPAQRAARLLQEKQRKLEEAKELARRLESEENAGREPLQFSKRTAFDIRFDQIEDKPWERGAGEVTDFFNYGLSEEEWLEYGQQQLAIRQELIEASREKRAVDPNIVPVVPKKPSSASSQVVSASVDAPVENGDDDDGGELGPSATGGTALAAQDVTDEETKKYYNIDVGYNGAWGTGSSFDSKLLHLIEEQQRNDQHSAVPSKDYPVHDEYSNDQGYQVNSSIAADERYGNHNHAWADDGRPQPPPPPPHQGFHGRGFAGRFDSRARGGRGGRFQQWEHERGGDRQYEQRGNWR